MLFSGGLIPILILVTKVGLDGYRRAMILPTAAAAWNTIIAVLTIFYAVAHWNSYFPAMLYLPDPDLRPLQMFPEKLLIQNDPSLQQDMDQGVDFLFVAVLPIITVYPFLQKHFVKGVMIGAIKG